jgi:hypothetical protein
MSEAKESQIQSIDKYVPEIKKLPKIKLADGRNEQEKHEKLADLFAIIVAMEHLETAYVRDCVTEQKYTATCKHMLSQFKTMSAEGILPDLDVFMAENRLNCPLAATRLKQGVPATVRLMLLQDDCFQMVLHLSLFHSANQRFAYIHLTVLSFNSIIVCKQIINGSGSSDSNKTVHVFEAVQHFITTMNILELNRRAVDQVFNNAHPQ